MKRLTLKGLLSLCNEALKRVEIDLDATEIYRTRYRSHEYEGGAAFFNVKLQVKESPHYVWVHIFYPLSYIQQELNNGSRILFKASRLGGIQDAEFDLSLKNKL